MGAAQNGGRQAAYDAAEAQGVVFKKQWIATHDYRTRYSHDLVVEFDDEQKYSFKKDNIKKAPKNEGQKHSQKRYRVV